MIGLPRTVANKNVWKNKSCPRVKKKKTKAHFRRKRVESFYFSTRVSDKSVIESRALKSSAYIYLGGVWAHIGRVRAKCFPENKLKISKSNVGPLKNDRTK